jgi:RND family efflux transporter MFP subunit
MKMNYLVVSLVLLLGAGCSDKNAYVPPPPAQVYVSQPVEQKVGEYLDMTGNTQAIKTVQLVARVQGYLENVFFHDGDYVKKGQRLFLIQQDTYKARLEQADAQIQQQKASLDHAETELKRFSELVRQHAAAQTDLDNWRYQVDNAKAAFVAAKANRDLVKLDLSYTEVVAPFDGRIDRRLKDPGNLVGAGEFTPLALITQIDPIYVYFTISEIDLNKVIKRSNRSVGQAEKLNLAVWLGLSADNGYPHAGHLDFTAITVTPTTGTLLMRAVFPNANGLILPGLFARVRMQVPDSEKISLLVPEQALGYDQLGAYLLVVNADKVVERRSVKLGEQIDGRRVVTEGIAKQDWVVVNGLMRAIPGNSVDPVRQAQEGANSQQDGAKEKP